MGKLTNWPFSIAMLVYQRVNFTALNWDRLKPVDSNQDRQDLPFSGSI
jgi:hypothetical protein